MDAIEAGDEQVGVGFRDAERRPDLSLDCGPSAPEAQRLEKLDQGVVHRWGGGWSTISKRLSYSARKPSK
jgi:hypothetical protein